MSMPNNIPLNPYEQYELTGAVDNRKIIHTCDSCTDPVMEGDEYINTGFQIICMHCLEDFTTKEWLALYDESVHIAEAD